jgi:hypothetical protein
MDGVIHAHEAVRMTRKQALELLAARGDRMAQLMLAGPEITPEDEERLRAASPFVVPALRAFVVMAHGC